ncbi:hypothetical protein DSECCO2_99640 [anaerobic digester metagenome]
MTMSKTVKTAISMPQDLHDAVREYAGDGKFSTALCELLRKALFPEGEATGPITQDDSMLKRLETLEHEMNEFRDQIMQEFKNVKLSFLTEKVRTSPKMKILGVRYGYIKLEGEVKQQILDRCEIMQAAGLTQEDIAPIMGLKGKSVVSQIRSGEKKSMKQQGYDALMAWTP